MIYLVYVEDDEIIFKKTNLKGINQSSDLIPFLPVNNPLYLPIVADNLQDCKDRLREQFSNTEFRRCFGDVV